MTRHHNIFAIVTLLIVLVSQSLFVIDVFVTARQSKIQKVTLQRVRTRTVIHTPKLVYFIAVLSNFLAKIFGAALEQNFEKKFGARYHSEQRATSSYI